MQVPQLRFALRGLGLVPILTGLASVYGGSRIVPEHGAVNPNVDSELRFFSVWWIGLGIYLWSLAPRIEERGRELRIVCALLFAGGLARLWGMADAGQPADTFIVLMVVEWVLAAVLVAWHALAARPR